MHEAVFRTNGQVQTDVQFHIRSTQTHPSSQSTLREKEMPEGPDPGLYCWLDRYRAESFDPAFTLAGKDLLVSVAVRLLFMCRNSATLCVRACGQLVLLVHRRNNHCANWSFDQIRLAWWIAQANPIVWNCRFVSWGNTDSEVTEITALLSCT